MTLSRVVAVTALVVVTTACAPGGFPEAASGDMRTSERLRARAERALAHTARGDFDGLLTMKSARVRRDHDEQSVEERGQERRNFETQMMVDAPQFAVGEVQLLGRRGRVTVNGSIRNRDGTRTPFTVYDYWVFENGDWYLEDADRTE